MVRPITVDNPKLTMQFNGGVNGWSESHFYTNPVPLNDATLNADAFALCKARCKALDGVNAKLFAAVLSLDNVNRDSNAVDIDGIVPSPTKGYAGIGGPDPSDVTSWAYQTVQMSWHVQLETTNPTTNPGEYLAGMPASVSQFGPLPQNDTPPTVASFLQSYLNVLTNGKWGALGRDWVSALYNIASIITVPASGATPTEFQITFATPFPISTVFPPGAYCRLQNAIYSTPQKRLRLNGTYTVTSYDPTAGVLRVAVPRVIVAPNFQSYGNMQSADGAVYPYATWNFRPMTHRKRGRPFGGGRGRR